MPMQKLQQLASTRALLPANALVLAASLQAASAADNTPPDSATFGSRTDRPDGSAAMTIGRRLPTEWETKVGTDVSLAAPPGTVATDNMLRGARAIVRRDLGQSDRLRSTAARPGQDSVEARLDAGKDEGRLGATLSRSVPINQDVSVTLQNIYSVKQSLEQLPAGLPP